MQINLKSEADELLYQQRYGPQHADQQTLHSAERKIAKSSRINLISKSCPVYISHGKHGF